MNEDYVSLEAAKLLHKKGYNLGGKGIFVIDEEIFRQNAIVKPYPKYGSTNEDPVYKVFIPTIYTAQKWLRKAKNIHIDIYRNASGWLYNLCKADNGTLIVDGQYKGPNDGGSWDSYEEALQAGILEALKFI